MFKATVNYSPSGLNKLFYLFKPGVAFRKKDVRLVRTLPSKWEEITADHIRALAKARFLIDDLDEKRQYLVLKFLDIKPWVLAELPLDDMLVISEHINKQLGENKLSHWPLKSIYVGMNQWIGPETRGASMSFLEFIEADRYYTRFVASRKMEWLDMLCAILYRPVGNASLTDHDFDGDLRIPMNAHECKKRALKSRRIAAVDKYVVLYQYEGFRNWIQASYPLTFSESGSKSKHGMGGLVISLAGQKFGDDKAVEQKKLHVILTSIEMAREEAEKMGL